MHARSHICDLQTRPTNSWSSTRIRDVYSLPVALLAPLKCSSVFDVHTIDVEQRGRQVRSCTSSVFRSTVSHRSSTVFQLSINRFDTFFFYRYVAVFGSFTMQRKRNGNFILTPTVVFLANQDHILALCVASTVSTVLEMGRIWSR